MITDLNRKYVYLSASAVLLLIFFVSAYFMFIAPAEGELESVQSQLEFEENLLEEISGPAADTRQYESHEIQAFLQKVPYAPNTEHWLLDLERAEAVSGTLITSYSFSEGEYEGVVYETATETEEVDVSVEAEAEVEDGDTTAEAEVEAEVEVETETEENLVTESAVPPPVNGLKAVSVSLDVDAEDYPELFRFIEEIERFERVTHINAVSFEGYGEPETLTEDEELTLSFNIELSTFYLPEMEDEFQDFFFHRNFEHPVQKVNPLWEPGF
jgi:type IV pilus assembly protein PilO